MGIEGAVEGVVARRRCRVEKGRAVLGRAVNEWR